MVRLIHTAKQQHNEQAEDLVQQRKVRRYRILLMHSTHMYGGWLWDLLMMLR